MKKLQSELSLRKSRKLLLALIGLTLVTGCATVSDDEGQTRDRPTGGIG